MTSPPRVFAAFLFLFLFHACFCQQCVLETIYNNANCSSVKNTVTYTPVCTNIGSSEVPTFETGTCLDGGASASFKTGCNSSSCASCSANVPSVPTDQCFNGVTYTCVECAATPAPTAAPTPTPTPAPTNGTTPSPTDPQTPAPVATPAPTIPADAQCVLQTIYNGDNCTGGIQNTLSYTHDCTNKGDAAHPAFGNGFCVAGDLTLNAGCPSDTCTSCSGSTAIPSADTGNCFGNTMFQCVSCSAATPSPTPAPSPTPHTPAPTSVCEIVETVYDAQGCTGSVRQSLTYTDTCHNFGDASFPAYGMVSCQGATVSLRAGCTNSSCSDCTGVVPVLPTDGSCNGNARFSFPATPSPSSSPTAVLCVSENEYSTNDCTGAPTTTLYYTHACTNFASGGFDAYGQGFCDGVTMTVTAGCKSSDCTNCTQSSLPVTSPSTCYPSTPGSVSFECVPCSTPSPTAAQTPAPINNQKSSEALEAEVASWRGVAIAFIVFTVLLLVVAGALFVRGRKASTGDYSDMS